MQRLGLHPEAAASVKAEAEHLLNKLPNVDSIVLGQAAGVEHVSFYSRTELLIFPYNEP